MATCSAPSFERLPPPGIELGATPQTGDRITSRVRFPAPAWLADSNQRHPAGMLVMAYNNAAVLPPIYLLSTSRFAFLQISSALLSASKVPPAA